MSTLPPPNDALAELAAVLGEDNVRTLVRTFLRDFPVSIRELQSSDRLNQHRIAHSMKSNTRLMGAYTLSEYLADLETRLSEEGSGRLTSEDLRQIAAQFEAIASPLRTFVG